MLKRVFRVDESAGDSQRTAVSRRREQNFMLKRAFRVDESARDGAAPADLTPSPLFQEAKRELVLYQTCLCLMLKVRSGSCSTRLSLMREETPHQTPNPNPKPQPRPYPTTHPKPTQPTRRHEEPEREDTWVRRVSTKIGIMKEELISAKRVFFGRSPGSSGPGSGRKVLILAKSVLLGRSPGGSGPGSGRKVRILAKSVLLGRSPGGSDPGSGRKALISTKSVLFGRSPGAPLAPAAGEGVKPP